MSVFSTYCDKGLLHQLHRLQNEWHVRKRSWPIFKVLPHHLSVKPRKTTKTSIRVGGIRPIFLMSPFPFTFNVLQGTLSLNLKLLYCTSWSSAISLQNYELSSCFASDSPPNTGSTFNKRLTHNEWVSAFLCMRHPHASSTWNLVSVAIMYPIL